MRRKYICLLSLLIMGVTTMVAGGCKDGHKEHESADSNVIEKDSNVVEDQELQALKTWQAGAVVSEKTVKAFGYERCFAAEPIPDQVWQRMQGKSYQENPYIGRDDLRYIRTLHWDYDEQPHLGEMVCNKKIADILLKIFRQLYEAHYPIQRMLLPDVYDADDMRQMRDNNSSCFCFRMMAASNKLSKHARGLAVDINTLYNPYIKRLSNGKLLIQPDTGAKYCNRKGSFPYKIDRNDLAYKLFKANGFSWGGDWKHSKDYQHFEWPR